MVCEYNEKDKSCSMFIDCRTDNLENTVISKRTVMGAPDFDTLNSSDLTTMRKAATITSVNKEDWMNMVCEHAKKHYIPMQYQDMLKMEYYK